MTPQGFSCEFQRLRLGSPSEFFMPEKSLKRSQKKSYQGLFFTFEGPEGSGKTTQCQRLARWLINRGQPVVVTREPGGTSLAEAIRELLLRQNHGSKGFKEVMTPECETALILAARSQHLAHVILPALQKGITVLCDRFFDSTLAYQGYGRGINLQVLTRFNTFVTAGIEPDLTFLLDLPVKAGLERRKKTRRQNRLDRESLAFHERVRRGFLALAQKNPARWRTLDGRCSPEQLAQDILTLVQPFFSTRIASNSAESSRGLKQAFRRKRHQS